MQIRSETELQKVLLEILHAAIKEDGAFAGNMQLLNPQTGNLEIRVQHGFPPSFVQAFQMVQTSDPCVCGRAFRLGKRVTEFDVTLDPQFKLYLHLAQEVGFRAVQSTPILDVDGCVVGVLSTHFRHPHRLSAAGAVALDLHAANAARVIQRC